MKNALSIALFTCVVTAFYYYVGQLVPQKEVHPPKSVEIRTDMSQPEMIEAGKIIVEGKGTCLNCHNGSARFPLLDDIGARAGTQHAGLSDVEYLAEALYEPNEFVVKPFAPGMPAVNKPPIGLTDQEILCVIAFLQSKGGKPSVDMNTKLKYQGGAAAPAASAAQPAAAESLDGKAMVAKFGCMGCHSFDAPIRMVGPSLIDVGKRLNKGQLYEALIDPDATLAEGFPPGMMSATLAGTGFMDKTNPAQMKVLVDYLSSLKGP